MGCPVFHAVVDQISAVEFVTYVRRACISACRCGRGTWVALVQKRADGPDSARRCFSEQSLTGVSLRNSLKRR